MNWDMPLIRWYPPHQKLQNKPHNDSHIHSSPATQAANTSLCGAHSRDLSPGMFSSCPWLPSSCNYFSFIDPNDDFDSKSLRERSPNAETPYHMSSLQRAEVSRQNGGSTDALWRRENTLPSAHRCYAWGCGRGQCIKGHPAKPLSDLDLKKMILRPRGVSQQLCSVGKMSYF